MKTIRHTETSRDSLYQDLTDCLEAAYELYLGGDRKYRFIVTILCAIKLEAFINVAGKLSIKSWNGLERKLGFLEKCEIICEVCGKSFDKDMEPNKTALTIFEVRNALVHPKMKTSELNELITEEEYEIRRKKVYFGIYHPLRKELSIDRIKSFKKAADDFVEFWGDKWIDHPDYWLRGGSTGGFKYEPNG